MTTQQQIAQLLNEETKNIRIRKGTGSCRGYLLIDIKSLVSRDTAKEVVAQVAPEQPYFLKVYEV